MRKAVKRWKPKLGQFYYAVFVGGKIEDFLWMGSNFDKWNYRTGNCAQTAKAAQPYKKKLLTLGV